MFYRSARSRRLDRAFAAILILIFAITFLKAVRVPNLYSATTFALNYSQGFVRRGFVGEVFRRVFGDLTFSYWFFASFAFSVLVLSGIALGIVVKRALRAAPRDVGFKCVLLAFAASPGLLFFVHEVGYLDHFGFLGLLLFLLWAPRSKHRFAIFYVVLGMGLIFALIHEILAPMFAPVIFFALLCHIVRRAPDTRSFGTRAVMVAHAVIVVLLVLSLSGLVSTLGSDNVPRVLALQASIAAKADFALRPDVFDALHRSSEYSLMVLMPWYYDNDFPPALVLKSCLSMLPSFAFMLVYGLHSIARLEIDKKVRWLLGATFVAASSAPLALNLIGWDWNRWNAIAVLACFGCVVSLRLFLPSRRGRTSVPLVVAGVLAVAISLASDTVLFDQARVQFYPFEQQFEFIRRLFETDFRYRPRS